MEEEDDYLSDKFLLDANLTATQTTKSYSQRRKEAERQSRLKNEKNKLKSRHQREVESREEGLSKSLFEKAKEQEQSGIGSGNKALGIMMKMGFKPGQSLGVDDDHAPTPTPADDGPSDPETVNTAVIRKQVLKHKVEPLPINDEWMGAFSRLPLLLLLLALGLL
jgi:hypothetical protein